MRVKMRMFKLTAIIIPCLFLVCLQVSSAAIHEVITEEELSQALADASDGDIIQLGGSFSVSPDYDFAVGTRNLTLDTNGYNLTVHEESDKAPVKTGTGKLILSDSTGNGSLKTPAFGNVEGIIQVSTANTLNLTGDASVGVTAGENGEILLEGATSITGNAMLGKAGSGTLTVKGTTAAVDGNITLGNTSTGTGNINITGTGTTLNVTGGVSYGPGTWGLSLTEGSELSISGGLDGVDSVAGSITVSGENSVLNITKNVSLDSNTTVAITDSGSAVFGADFQFKSSVNVDNGTLEVSGDTLLGTGGSFSIRDGASVSLGGSLNGWDMTNITLSGTDSSLTISGNADISAGIADTLDLSDGQRISIGGDLNFTQQASSNSVITVSDENSKLDVSGSFKLDAGNVSLTAMNSGSINIGNLNDSVGTFTLTSKDGGSITILGDLSLGDKADLENTVTVTGENSSFSVGGNTILGNLGTGTLDISDSATAQMAGNLTLGNTGTGVLNISSGSSVTVGTSDVPSEVTLGAGTGGTAEINISGENSKFITYGNISSGSESSVTITLNDSATFGTSGDLKLSGSGNINVNTATTLEVGGNLTLAKNVGDTYTLAVSGENASAIISGSMIVGQGGDGIANITGGASLSAGSVTLGADANSSGTVLLSGTTTDYTPSHAEISGALKVGDAGTGNLIVEKGTTLTTGSAILGNASTGDGEVSVSGKTVNNESSSWTNSGALIVGNEGKGVLTISDTAGVTTDTLSVGTADSSRDENQVSVSGDNSYLKVTNQIIVGDKGTGTLSYSSAATGTGTDLYIGNQRGLGEEGGNGTVTLDGLNTTLTLSGNVYVGYAGTGSLQLSNYAQMSGSWLYTSTQSQGDGSITVSSKASLTLSERLMVGNQNDSILNITTGGKVSADIMYLGHYGTATGTAIVDGSGSVLAVSNELAIGSLGQGILNVTDQGKVTAGATYLGGDKDRADDIGGIGRLTLNDATLESAGEVVLGFSAAAKGYVILENGSKGSGSTLTLGRESADGYTNAYGEMQITEGSSWTASGLLTVGSGGDGSLTVEDGSSLTSADAILAWGKDTTGNVIISGEDTVWHITKGNADTSTLVEGDSSLSVTDATLNMDDSAKLFMRGDATLDHAALNMGTTNTVIANYDSQDLMIQNGSTLTGSGTFWLVPDDVTLEDAAYGTLKLMGGSWISPGQKNGTDASTKIGTFYVDGNLLLSSNSGFDVTLTGVVGSESSDVISVSKTADISGAQLKITLEDNAYTGLEKWTIIHADEGLTGKWDEENLEFTGPKFIKPIITYDQNTDPADNQASYVELGRSEYFQPRGTNQNSREVGRVLDQVDLTTWWTGLETLSNLSDSELDNAMTQISGSVRANASMLARQSLWTPLQERINWSCDGRAYLGEQNPYAPNTSQYTSVWVTPTYRHWNVDSKNGLDGFSVNTWGITVGVDRVLEDYLAAGIFMGVSNPILRQAGRSEVDVENYNIGGYFGYRFWTGLELRGMVAYTHHEFEMNRNLDFGDIHHKAYSTYAGSSFTANLELGHSFFMGFLVLRPMVACDLEYTWQNSVIESGANIYNLVYSETHGGWLDVRAGVTVQTSWDRINFNGRFFYVANVQDVASHSAHLINTSQEMTIYATDPGSSYFNLGIGGVWYMDAAKRASLYANYDALFGDSSQSHEVGFGFQWLF